MLAGKEQMQSSEEMSEEKWTESDKTTDEPLSEKEAAVWLIYSSGGVCELF